MGAIVVSNLGKAYKQYPTRWSRLWEWLTPGKRVLHSLKWVIQDVSFTVQPGEAVGIIGINGAGKSTLLKMITGTIQPTTGYVEISGRVAALLELGMGFHPDFTGRQNAYMAGQLLGYKVEDITNLMPSIETFAEIGDYIDQPIRVYSSGMQMRLAFSVATAHRPDVLIVDEALSVGDVYFQHKSFDRIREFRKQGTTLLIVSHDKAAIQNICDRIIFIEHGSIAMDGTPNLVFDFYNARITNANVNSIIQTPTKTGEIGIQSGTKEVTFEEVALLTEFNCPIDVVEVGSLVQLKVKYKVNIPVDNLTLGFMIKSKLGQIIFGTNTYHLKQKIESSILGEVVTKYFLFKANLGEGSYSISTSLHSSDTHLENNYQWWDLAVTFSVINTHKPFFIGNALLPTNFLSDDVSKRP